ncbi:hypothetical protein MAR_005916 [Mya arenaria]|uniref:Uncharacterized protein n=1 Tax=Mya arenaria TaxID=6604 RepID=A0ABY7DAS1_MYAAR|nr:hypothetical protein MAR_005916 [Mya arenaria]
MSDMRSTAMIGYFKTMDNMEVCKNVKPIPDLLECSGFCHSRSFYSHVMQGFNDRFSNIGTIPGTGVTWIDKCGGNGETESLHGTGKLSLFKQTAPPSMVHCIISPELYDAISSIVLHSMRDTLPCGQKAAFWAAVQDCKSMIPSHRLSCGIHSPFPHRNSPGGQDRHEHSQVVLLITLEEILESIRTAILGTGGDIQTFEAPENPFVDSARRGGRSHLTFWPAWSYGSSSLARTQSIMIGVVHRSDKDWSADIGSESPPETYTSRSN